jgi:tetratricopeptide (TPR) repeat protein
MSFLSKIFGSDPSSRRYGGGSLGKRISELEAQAKQEAAGFQGMPLNKAGDLCLDAGLKDEALKFYGRAIDALLEDQQLEAARGVANKLIRVHPGAVRTLCTLTWLDLAAHHLATALIHLRDYAQGFERVGQHHLARDHVVEMARVVPHREFLDVVADVLDRMDLLEEADRVRVWSAEGGSPDAIKDPEALSEYCLRAAVGSNRGRRGKDDPA